MRYNKSVRAKVRQEQERKRMKKNKTAAFLAALMVSACAPQTFLGASNVIVAEAHSGRTDANGGHRDKKNVSGLGSYHYHCGGHPAHLHTNGVCPYGKYTGALGSAAAAPASAKTKTEPAVPENISLVFDAKYYADNNSDLYAAYGYDKSKLLNHFLTDGMKEGRIACEGFNVNTYKENNADLAGAYGDDLSAYYTHYMNCGWAENRVCR